MKKRWKAFFIVCASVFGIGVVLCITGFTIGVSDRDVRNAFRDGFGRFGIFCDRAITDYDSHRETSVEQVEGERESYHGIRNLEVEVGKTEIQIAESDEEAILIERDMDTEYDKHVRIYQEGDTLKVEMEEWEDVDNDAGSMTLYVPKGMVFDSAELSVGAGSMEIENLRTRELDMEVGVGSIEADRIEAEDLSLTCGMGSIEMTAKGNKQDYNYDLDVGMGGITIGGSEFNGMAIEKQVQNHAVNNMEMECGMGSIEIYFEED